MRPRIAPSILSADPLRLHQQIESIKNEIEILHLDIMDGHFVPNLTFGPAFARAIKEEFPELILDVHLMVERPSVVLEWYLDAGADWLSFHIEATSHHHRYLSRIRERGARAGLALNPSTPLCLLEPSLPFLDFVLLLTVNPGFGGQRFIEEGLRKIEKLREIKEREGYGFIIEVDGGVKRHNLKKLINAGAEVLVAGSAVFAGDANRNLLSLKEELK